MKFIEITAKMTKEIVELVSDDDTVAVQAKSVCKFDSGKYAIMNCGMLLDDHKMAHIACGHNDKCYIYVIKPKIVTPKPNSSGVDDGQVRKRKSGLTHADSFKNAKKIVTFEVQQVDSVKTDFHQKDPYQNCAAFTPDGSALVTGGADGVIRMWKYPELTKIWERKAHDGEIDALDIDPKKSQICSISKDRKLLLWNVEDGKPVAELRWPTEPPVKYKQKACRYCFVDNDPSQLCLFSIEVPVTHKKGGGSCFISQWNINRHTAITRQAVRCGTLSCMDISGCGEYLAVGSLEGDVAVFDTTHLKCVYHKKNVHKTFVTGVAFARTSELSQLVSDQHQFTLLSISIDNQVKLHRPRKPGGGRRWLLLFIVLVLFWSLVTFLVTGYGFS